METKLLQTKDLNNRFFYANVDLQKPMAELQVNLEAKNVDIDNVIKGRIVLDFVKHMDERYDGLVSDYRPEETFDDHSSLISFNLLVEDTLSLSKILEDFVEWVSGKYPYSQELSLLVFELIKEVYDNFNDSFGRNHEESWYNVGKTDSIEEPLKYIVIYSSFTGSTVISEKIEKTIKFLPKK